MRDLLLHCWSSPPIIHSASSSSIQISSSPSFPLQCKAVLTRTSFLPPTIEFLDRAHGKQRRQEYLHNQRTLLPVFGGLFFLYATGNSSSIISRNHRFPIVHASFIQAEHAHFHRVLLLTSTNRYKSPLAFSVFRCALSMCWGSSDEVLGNLTKSLKQRQVRANAEGSNKSWWKRFLLQPIENDILLAPEFDLEDNGERDFNSIQGSEREEYEDDIDRMLEDDESFTAWKRRYGAASELRTERTDPDNKDWEDWLDDSWNDKNYAGGMAGGWYTSQSDWEKDGLPRDPPKIPTRGMSRTLIDYLMRIFDRQEELEDELAFEDRVFRFASQSSTKFVALLILLPSFVDFVTHDFVIVPFLNRYVETVPLAAKILDVRKSQKLEMIHKLKLERQRVRFEAAIGKAPPLTDKEFTERIRDEARRLQEEMRYKNRKSFGNIWSDMIAGITLMLLLIFNSEQVTFLKLTGKRLFSNVSDTGKAFIIILLSDIFLGYHSESGWETVIEMFLGHYGFEAEQASIYIFVAIVPVTIDAFFKLWVFRYLTRTSPSAVATFREMQRH